MPPTLDKKFALCSNFFGKTTVEKIPETVFIRFLDYANMFTENLSDDNRQDDDEDEERDNKFKNKNEAKQKYYFILTYLFKKLVASGFTLEDLMEPKTLKQYVVSRTYFNNFLEVMEMVDPRDKEYNHFAYRWIVNQEDLDEPIRVIENFNEPSYRITTIDGSYFAEYLKDNRIGLTISGTLFKIHENRLSLFYTFLNELYSLRNQYKKEMFKHPKGSFERNEFNRRQLTTKVIMNSTYGLLGMSSFRYSNKWLAKSITTSGRLALKTAQYFTEKYIDAKFLNN